MKTKYLLSALLLCLLSLTYVANAWSGYVNKDTSFNNSSYWKKVIPAHNDVPSQCGYYHDVSNSLIWEKCVDIDGNDWSDVVAYQGKALHTSGTWGTTLNYNPVFTRSSSGRDTLTISVCMKFDSMPAAKTEGSYNGLVSPFPHVAGAFVLLYFEFYYQNSNGQWQWSNINNPNAKDGFPDCFVYEMANRWWNDPYYSGGQWLQAGEGGLAFNFFTAHTTHDDDLHDIRCGWQWTQDEINNKAWHTFTVNVHGRFSDWFAWFDSYCANEGYLKGINKIDAVRLVAVAVTVETYRAQYSMNYCDLWVYASVP